MCPDSVCHPISWSSKLTRRVARSTTSAESQAAAEAYDSVIGLENNLPPTLLKSPKFLVVDSKDSFYLMSSAKIPAEQQLLRDLQAVREAFENGTLTGIIWAKGELQLADCLTKLAHVNAQKLTKVLEEPCLLVNITNSEIRTNERRGLVSTSSSLPSTSAAFAGPQ